MSGKIFLTPEVWENVLTQTIKSPIPEQKSNGRPLRIEKKLIKATNGKREFKRMLGFPFVDKRKLFVMNCFSRNSTLFLSPRSACLVLNLGVETLIQALWFSCDAE